jgi:hypothetical protein
MHLSSTCRHDYDCNLIKKQHSLGASLFAMRPSTKQDSGEIDAQEKVTAANGLS